MPFQSANHQLTQNPCATHHSGSFTASCPGARLASVQSAQIKSFHTFSINPHTKYYVTNINAKNTKEW